MSVRNFKSEEPYTLNGNLDELLQKLDLQHPSKMVIDEHSSVPQLLLDYISTQTHTNNELLRYISSNLTVPTQVDGTELSVEQQQLINEKRMAAILRRAEHWRRIGQLSGTGNYNTYRHSQVAATDFAT